MKEIKRKNTGTDSTPVKKASQNNQQTESRLAGERDAGKAGAWKIPAYYILWAFLFILLTGLIALCLGMNGSISGETGKNIVEILSSLLGSIYISFLLGRWKEKEWTTRRTPGEIKTGLIFGMVLFICRIISRLVFSLFPEEVKGIGYFTVLMIDLICIILIYSQMPAGRKEGRSHVQ